MGTACSACESCARACNTRLLAKLAMTRIIGNLVIIWGVPQRRPDLRCARWRDTDTLWLWRDTIIRRVGTGLYFSVLETAAQFPRHEPPASLLRRSGIR